MQTKHPTECSGKQRRCKRKRRRCARNQCKNRSQVDHTPPNSIYSASQQWTAGFGELLLITATDMDHKTKRNRKHDIKAPRDRSPVEKRICGCPFLHTAHYFDLRLIGIQRPLAQRIKQNVRSHGGCKNHSTPLKRAILRLFTVTKFDLAESGKGYVKCAAYDANAKQCIVEAKVVSQKAPYNTQDELGALRENHKQRTYRQYDHQRHQHRYPVKFSFQCVIFHRSIETAFVGWISLAKLCEAVDFAQVFF